ncbi:MAG: hypothetical protein ACKVOH_06895 [Chlamydiales bacterium]
MPEVSVEHEPIRLKKRGLRFSRNQFYLVLLCCFLFPGFMSIGFASSLLEGGDVRAFFLVVVLSSSLGGSGGWYYLRQWEKKMRSSVERLVQERCEHLEVAPVHRERELEELRRENLYLREQLEETRRGYEHQMDLLHSSVVKSKAQVNELNLEMDQKLEEMRQAYLEFEDLRKEYHRLEEEYRCYKQNERSKLGHKESLLGEYQRTISEQRGIIEKKQGYITKLEGKVHDLMYEIRSLLQLDEPVSQAIPPLDSSNQEEMQDYYLATPYDLDMHLGRYVEMAEKFTGADHLGYVNGSEPRFLDTTSNSYAIDLRRLFDSLRDEVTGIVFLFSLIENKILFTNNYVKTLLGWSPEKFVKEFPQLVEVGLSDWKEAIRALPEIQEKRVQLVLLHREGKGVELECEMKMIMRGPFAHHIMGMFTKID